MMMVALTFCFPAVAYTTPGFCSSPTFMGKKVVVATPAEVVVFF
jgi:hypothetical protein